MRSYVVVVLEGGKTAFKNITAKSIRGVKKVCTELGLIFQRVFKVASMVYTTSEDQRKVTQAVINRFVY